MRITTSSGFIWTEASITSSGATGSTLIRLASSALLEDELSRFLFVSPLLFVEHLGAFVSQNPSALGSASLDA